MVPEIVCQLISARSSGMPGVVIVSPYFPPSTLAGVHRARHLAKWLPAAGWDPIVLCVDEACHEQALDPELAQLVPSQVEVVKVGAIPAALTRVAGLGDVSLRAWFPLRSAMLSLAERPGVEAVIITGAPFYPMMLAPALTERFGLPVVLDFQDPWVSAWGARRPMLSKSGVYHRVATLLEPKVLRAASHITTVSSRQYEELAARYPWLDRSSGTEMPIGADPDDFEALRRAGGRGLGGHADKFTIAYVGTIWPPVLPTLRAFLRALAMLRGREEIYKRLRVLFVGSSGNPNATATHLVRSLAEAEGVGDVVEETPQRLPYLDALSITARADANLVLGSDEPHYTASKVFGILMAGRPYLSLLRPESSAHAVCRSAGGGICLTFASHDTIGEVVPQVADAIARLVTAPRSFGRASPAAYAPFEASAIAARYGRILDGLPRRPRRG